MTIVFILIGFFHLIFPLFSESSSNVTSEFEVTKLKLCAFGESGNKDIGDFPRNIPKPKQHKYIHNSNHSSQAWSKLKKRAEETYNRLIPCMKDSWFIEFKEKHKECDVNTPITMWSFPKNAFQHYHFLLAETKKYRTNIPVHIYGNYSGPWIENRFIDYFIKKPLEYFNGLIPLFLQLVDLHIVDMDQPRNHTYEPISIINSMWDHLLPLLRDDCIYVIVSQDDQGISERIYRSRPNILVLSAGGFGHIPIPLIKGDNPFSNLSLQEYNWDVSFIGSRRPALSRSKMITEMEDVIKYNLRLRYISTSAKNWTSYIEKSKFNLAPRGWGRTSFRLAEIIQIGRIPIYLYDDIPFIPYAGTPVSIMNFGFMSQWEYLDKFKMKRFLSMSDEDYINKINVLKQNRYYYTYEGIIEQIDSFFRDPFGINSYLRCQRVPKSDR